MLLFDISISDEQLIVPYQDFGTAFCALDVQA